jgi:hypothetical protein
VAEAIGIADTDSQAAMGFPKSGAEDAVACMMHVSESQT